MDKICQQNKTDVTPDATQADRIALNNMFRAIAEYGHKVRLRRQAESAASEVQLDQPEQNSLPVKYRRRQ